MPSFEHETIGLPALKVGRFYQVKASGHSGFVILNLSSETSAEGSFYATDDGPFAPVHTFKAEIQRRNVLVSIDGGADKKYSIRTIAEGYTFTPYEEPTFKPVDLRLYRKPIYGISVTNDIPFAHSEGYWCSIVGYQEKSYAKMVTEGFAKSFSKRDLELCLDLYQPQNSKKGKHPFILFLHGGAFYVGDKQYAPMVDWCRHFASLGYVTASMNYRMGFLPTKYDIERAGYMAIQDANAAMRFIVSHADEYGIDTDELYLAGTSAGSITALNLVFMREENRPDASRGKDGLFKRERNEDLGSLTSSGNDIKADFHIRAIANMWGAVNDLSILNNSHTDIVSFHGDADQLVPYDKGYPFSDIGMNVGKHLFGEMYGSAAIDKRTRSLGRRSKLYTFPGEGHALNVDKEGNPNGNHTFIRDSIAAFFYDEMVPKPVTLRAGRRSNGRYRIDNIDDVATVSWKVEGGFIVDSDSIGIRVLWRDDLPVHKISATGTYRNGIGWLRSLSPISPNAIQKEE